jgi:hypothetical protein
MPCETCGGEHATLTCDDAGRTPPIIMRHDMEAQLMHQVIEAAMEWYGASEHPFHPSPSGRRWQIFIRRLSQLTELRKGP